MMPYRKTLIRATVFGIVVAVASWTRATAQEAEPTSKPPASDDAKASARKVDDKPGSVENPVRALTAEPRTPTQPTAADIIKAFERDRPVNTPVRPRRTGAPWAARRDGSRTHALLREGEYIHNKVGRVIRDGVWWAFQFESDSPTARQAPMRILPNQQLERLVMEVTAAATSPVFVVSGEVTMFESANYVLLRKVLKRRTPRNLQK